MLDSTILRRAVGQAFVKLNPRHMMGNPVMFAVEVGSLITTLEFVAQPSAFVGSITFWLWATVLFANFAEAVAEGRGKAQADTLRRTRQDAVACVRQPDGTIREVAPSLLQIGDHCVVEAGQIIPGDGDVIEGIATVDESAITGESAPVIRESGGDRCAVTGGTIVLSDRIVLRITSNPGDTFIDRMIALVEGARRQKTPNEIALDILISGLTLILLVAVVTLQPMAIYSKAIQSTAVLVRSSSASRPRRSAACCLRSASPGWIAWCSGTSWPCRDVLSRRPETARPYSSTRPGRSPTATGWQTR
jgi:potassium-transporting ATPase ATP-binding subunit